MLTLRSKGAFGGTLPDIRKSAGRSSKNTRRAEKRSTIKSSRAKPKKSPNMGIQA